MPFYTTFLDVYLFSHRFSMDWWFMCNDTPRREGKTHYIRFSGIYGLPQFFRRKSINDEEKREDRWSADFNTAGMIIVCCDDRKCLFLWYLNACKKCAIVCVVQTNLRIYPTPSLPFLPESLAQNNGAPTTIVHGTYSIFQLTKARESTPPLSEEMYSNLQNRIASNEIDFYLEIWSSEWGEVQHVRTIKYSIRQ